jgi:hypothetical protein
MDLSFSTSYLPEGNVPGFTFDRSKKFLYIFHHGLEQAQIFKANAVTGDEITSTSVGPTGIDPWAGDVNVNNKGEIYFARCWDRGDGSWGSAWGKVVDSHLSKEMVDNDDEAREPTALSKYELFQNNPNPFNPTTRISYSLADDTHVRIFICNTLGQITDVLVDEHQSKGAHTVTWNARSQPSGIYICRMETNRYTATNKMFLLK